MTIKDEDEGARPPPIIIDLSHDDEEEDVKDPAIVQRDQQTEKMRVAYEAVRVKQEGHTSAYIEEENDRGGAEEDDEEEQEQEEQDEEDQDEPLPDDVRAQMEYHAYVGVCFYFRAWAHGFARTIAIIRRACLR